MLQISWYFTCKYLSSMYFLTVGTFSIIVMYHYCNWEVNSNSVLLSTVEKSTVTQCYPITIPKKGTAKECSNYCTIALISHASKVMLKILWTMNFQMFKLNIEMAKRNQRSNCQQPLDNWKRKRVPETHLLLLYWLHQSLWLCGSQQTVENS